MIQELRGAQLYRRRPASIGAVVWAGSPDPLWGLSPVTATAMMVGMLLALAALFVNLYSSKNPELTPWPSRSHWHQRSSGVPEASGTPGFLAPFANCRLTDMSVCWTWRYAPGMLPRE